MFNSVLLKLKDYGDSFNDILNYPHPILPRVIHILKVKIGTYQGKIMSSQVQNSCEEEWTKVATRKNRREKPRAQESKVYAIKQYWNGFNNQGDEKWYIELSNGSAMSNRDKDYEFWAKRYRSS